MSAEIFAYSNFDDLSDPFMMIFAVIYAIVMLVSFAFAVVMYILQSAGMYSIAKRRGIHHPGLAWVPLACWWIMGSISDQYQYVVKGKVRNRRKLLLGLSIPTLVLSIVTIGLALYNASLAMMDGGEERLILLLFVMLGLSLILFVLSTVLIVFQYIATYDLFMSCTPKNAVLFLVLNLLFGLGAVFIFACRNKDEGMPPRKIQVPVAPWTPAPPPPAPAWQQSVAPAVPVVEAPAVEEPASVQSEEQAE